MKQFILIALVTGHLYEIPAQIVADDRAKAMLEAHPDEFKTIEEAMADTVGLFEDDYSIKDWMMNNMNPPEYMPHARLVRFTPPELDLNTAEFSYSDAPALIPQLDASSVLSMPVEMALSAMAAHQNICQIAALNDDKGQPAAAVVLVQGGPAIVGMYTGALQHLTSTFLKKDETTGQVALAVDTPAAVVPGTDTQH